MRSIIKNLKRKLHNSGSSLVLVIVALAFVGILTGSLLTAVAYAYRQKLYDYNARSNFYYLDQAMDELYAGVGSLTMDSLTEAYEATREQSIYFDMDTETYKTKDNAVANDIFKNEFMKLIALDDRFKVVKSDGGSGYIFSDGSVASADDYKKSVVYMMENIITDSKVKLDSSKMKVRYVYTDGTPDSYTYTVGTLAKIVLENVKLTRTVEYNRSNAKGEFTQSIATDIEISRPDFTVDFGSNLQDMTTLFDFCLVADSGVDFDRIGGDVLTVSGNVYAANDFYNKAYNNYDGTGSALTYSDANNEYKMNKVSNYTYLADDVINSTLYNKGQVTYRSQDKAKVFYDGENDRSKYSGFYVDGGAVNILAERVIVPGSISVMNGGQLSVYGLSKSNSLQPTDVWTDEIILGGYALPYAGSTDRIGSSVSFNSNLYVLDDTQIESDFSTFKLTGSYYGYSNSAGTDGRVFIPTVTKSSTDTNIYQHKKVDINGNTIDGSIENKGHYNSSAILVNGQNSVIDLTQTKSIFIAGRSYIELSNIKTNSVLTYADKSKANLDSIDASTITDDNRVDYNDPNYQYDSVLNDYRTGESISKKSTQLAYYPGKTAGSLDDTKTHFVLASGSTSTNASNIANMRLFYKYFGWDADITKRVVTQIPVIVQTATVNGKEKTYYYFDFEQAVLDHKYDTTFFPSTDPTNEDRYIPDYSGRTDAEKAALKADGSVRQYADILQQNFIKDYYDYFNFCVNASSIKKLDYMGYEEGYDDDAYDTTEYSSPMDYDAFIIKYPTVDFNVLEPINNRVAGTETSTDISNARAAINSKANELQNVTNYEEYVTGQMAVPVKIGTENVDIYSSGAVTKSGNTFDKTFTSDENKEIQFDVLIDNDAVITSTVNDTYSTSNAANTLNFAANYRNHYNVIKWTLQDMPETSEEYKFVTEKTTATALASNSNMEAYITPLNYYLNFDKLTASPSTEVSPSNLNLRDYKVWSSASDVTVTGADSNGEITGIVIAKGDVFFGTDVKKFNGLIVSGGKVYITTSNTSLNTISATKVCRNIINECIAKASVYDSSLAIDADNVANSEAKAAINFLRLFKAYEDIADAAENGLYNPEEDLKITQINYSDIVRYNNWVRNYD